MHIVPAVIPQSKDHLFSSLEKIESGVPEIQIDLVDAAYGETPSWPWAGGGTDAELYEVMSEVSKMYDIEMDLMIESPERILEGLIEAGVKRIAFHPTKEGGWPPVASYRGRVLVGLAVHNDTPLDTFFALASQIDFVQCMGIAQVGSQGLPFDEQVLSTIKNIHTELPDLPISVDGHVSTFTIPLLKEAGASRFVAGSSIFSAEDPAHAYRKLVEMADA